MVACESMLQVTDKYFAGTEITGTGTTLHTEDLQVPTEATHLGEDCHQGE